MLSSFFVERTVDAKTLLIHQDQIAQEIYFIQSGLARLYYQTENRDQVTAFIFSENMFASCLESFIQQTSGNQNLETVESCSLLVLNRDGLEQLYKKLPKTNMIMRKVIEQRFISSQRLLASYILKNPQQRYEQFVSDYPHLIQRVPQYVIASFLGITSVSLSRIRKRISNS